MPPTIALHSNLRVTNDLMRVYESLGATVVRRGYSLEEIQTPHEAHLVWGMAHRPPVYRELAGRENVFFVENGWFTQRTGCYFDKQGTNASSSIRGMLRGWSPVDEQMAAVEGFISNLHRSVQVRPSSDERDYLFVPLQVEKDTQFLYWSGCKACYGRRQRWFVEQVCAAFPDRRIIVRPHPRDGAIVEKLNQSDAVRGHGNVHVRTDGGSYDWLANAWAVAGMNSTVLLEALTFFKPVAAMGQGVFSDNGVVLECNGHASRLKALGEFEPDGEQIRNFLALLISRQIPYNLAAGDAHRYEVFTAVLEAARRCQGRAPAVAIPAGVKLDLGCGNRKSRPGFIGVDVRAMPHVTHQCNAWEIADLFAPMSADEIYARHLLQTLTFAQGERTLRACARVLRPGGRLEVVVPDIRYHFDQLLNKDAEGPSGCRNFTNRQHGLASLWGWQRHGMTESWDVHKSGYDESLLSERLRDAGFTEIERQPSEPWHLHVWSSPRTVGAGIYAARATYCNSKSAGLR